MPINGFRMKKDKEMSDYERRVDAIDNVILCVAEAEKLVEEMGRTLVEGIEVDRKFHCPSVKPKKTLWNGRKRLFKK